MDIVTKPTGQTMGELVKEYKSNHPDVKKACFCGRLDPMARGQVFRACGNRHSEATPFCVGDVTGQSGKFFHGSYIPRVRNHRSLGRHRLHACSRGILGTISGRFYRRGLSARAETVSRANEAIRREG